MLSILLKAILIYAIFRIIKGMYNAYQLSKKIKAAWSQSTKESSSNSNDNQVFEAKFRHLDDD